MKKMREKQIVRARSVGEGVLFVLPSSCSITPPAGEGGSLQQVVGGMQWRRQKRTDENSIVTPAYLLFLFLIIPVR